VTRHEQHRSQRTFRLFCPRDDVLVLAYVTLFTGATTSNSLCNCVVGIVGRCNDPVCFVGIRTSTPGHYPPDISPPTLHRIFMSLGTRSYLEVGVRLGSRSGLEVGVIWRKERGWEVGVVWK